MAQITGEMIKAAKLDFSNFFRRWAPNIRAEYKRKMTMKQGILGDPAPSNAESVRIRKGKDHWMVDTNELHDKGMEWSVFEAGGIHGLKVYASDKQHSGRYTYMRVPGGHKGQKRGVRRPRTERHIKQRRGPHPTYEQLFMWHNKKGYSGIMGKLSHNSKFIKEFAKEANAQMKAKLPKEMRLRIEAKI